RFFLLDSGALYRSMALHLTRLRIEPEGDPIPESALKSLNLVVEPAIASMKLFLDGADVGRIIRQEQVGEAASRFSARPEVRRALLDLQRSIGAKGRVVAEGRDMGTVVFPHADVKFFLTADLEERSARRYRELVREGAKPRVAEVRSEMSIRDRRDESRAESPLTRASDALVLDTTDHDPDEVLRRMIAHVAEKLPDICA
ncbi:MAG: (d)CMP kinase, partial [Deltaproteobacteria bacterium]